MKRKTLAIIATLTCMTLILTTQSLATATSTVKEPLWVKKASLYHPDEECVVWSTSVSDDGQYIAFSFVCGYVDATDIRGIKFYNQDGNYLWSKTKERGTPYYVLVSSKGDYILSGWSDDDVVMFDKSGNQVWGFNFENFECLSMSLDGSKVAVGTFHPPDPEGDSTVYFLENGKLKWGYTTYGGIEDVAVSSDGSYVAVGTSERWVDREPWLIDDNKIYLLNQYGHLLWSKELSAAVISVAVSTDGSVFAGTDNAQTYAFDKDGNILWHFEEDGGYVCCSKDGRTILSYGSRFYLFDNYGNMMWNTSEIIAFLGTGHVSLNGEYIALSGGEKHESIGENSHIYLFSKNGTLLWRYSPHANQILRPSVSSNGYVAFGAKNNLYLFDKSTPTPSPPIISSTLPTSGEVNVPIDTTITITFSEAMNKTAVQNAITISGGLTATSFIWSNGDKTVTFVPSSTLEYDTQYTITINASIAEDIARNKLDGNEDGVGGDDYSWSFNTELETGTISGTIKDEKGNPIHNVKVIIYYVDGTAVDTTKTDENGNYAIDLPVGTYDVKIEKSGYKIQWEKNVTITPDQITTTDLTLPLASNILSDYWWIIPLLIIAIIIMTSIIVKKKKPVEEAEKEEEIEKAEAEEEEP